jgi:hypothetical protein
MRSRKGWLTMAAVMGFGIVGTGAAVSAANDYAEEIEAWRADREARLKADDGWLTVSALFFLPEGESRFGSSPRNDLVLPEPFPAEAGVLDRRGRTVSVRTAGDPLTVDGEPVTAAQLYPAEGRVTLTMGPVSFWVHESGERLAIRVRDTESAIRRNFTHLDWYPVDESYRVRGKFTPHAEPLTVRTMNILGDIETYQSTGHVTLTVAGREVRMLPVNSGDQLWFILRDATSGDETYPAARFLYADAPDADGWTTVDFNKAYNPPCAFNPHTTCPLPPPDNRLEVRVEAGEKSYGGPGAH